MIFVGKSKGFLSIGVERCFSFVVLRCWTADLVFNRVQGFHVEQLEFFRRNRRRVFTDGLSIFQWWFVCVTFFLEKTKELRERRRRDSCSRLSWSSVDVVRVFERRIRSSPETIEQLRCRTWKTNERTCVPLIRRGIYRLRSTAENLDSCWGDNNISRNQRSLLFAASCSSPLPRSALSENSSKRLWGENVESEAFLSLSLTRSLVFICCEYRHRHLFLHDYSGEHARKESERERKEETHQGLSRHKPCRVLIRRRFFSSVERIVWPRLSTTSPSSFPQLSLSLFRLVWAWESNHSIPLSSVCLFRGKETDETSFRPARYLHRSQAKTAITSDEKVACLAADH